MERRKLIKEEKNYQWEKIVVIKLKFLNKLNFLLNSSTEAALHINRITSSNIQITLV